MFVWQWLEVEAMPRGLTYATDIRYTMSMTTFEFDLPDGTIAAFRTFEDAEQAAKEELVRTGSLVPITIYHNDKNYGVVGVNVTQTIHTDPGF